MSFASYHITHSGGLKTLSLVEDGTHRINKSLPSWVPDPAASSLPRSLEVGNGSKNSLTPWNACGSHTPIMSPVINGNLLTVEGYRIDVIEKNAMPFNVIAENDQWSKRV